MKDERCSLACVQPTGFMSEVAGTHMLQYCIFAASRLSSRADVCAGASMLGKKQKRDFDRTVLHQVKAKPMKGPGIPASLGLRKALPVACWPCMCVAFHYL